MDMNRAVRSPFLRRHRSLPCTVDLLGYREQTNALWYLDLMPGGALGPGNKVTTGNPMASASHMMSNDGNPFPAGLYEIPP